MFFGLADTEFLQIYQLPTNRVDLLSEITAKFAYKKSGFSITGSMLDKEFLEEFGSAVRSKKLGKTRHIVFYNIGKYRFPK
jgi:hypothetical protein